MGREDGGLGETKLEEDGFEIVDPELVMVNEGKEESESRRIEDTGRQGKGKEGKGKGKEKRYQIMAVRPAAAFVPMLQNLLSGFVMGLTKSARAVSGILTPNGAPSTGQYDPEVPSDPSVLFYL